MSTEIVVQVARQRLLLLRDGETLSECAVSTALNGPGETRGSGCTPRGLHRVRARIGAGCATCMVFVGRRPSDELFSEPLALAHPGRDWILTRILWLTGCEPGRNRHGQVDTLRRFIYLHGCPDGTPMGVAASHGCIRMRNADIVALSERVGVGTAVRIVP